MEKGIIKNILNDDTATVTVTLRGDCGNCPGRPGCDLFKSGTDLIKVRCRGLLAPGDEVVIEFDPVKRVISSLVIFLFPLLALIASYFAGRFITGREGSAIVISFAGFFFSFIIILIVSRLAKRTMSFLPDARKFEDPSASPER